VSLNTIAGTLNTLKLKISDYKHKFRVYYKGNFMFIHELTKLIDYVDAPPEWDCVGHGFKYYVLVIRLGHSLPSYSKLSLKDVANKLNSYCISFDDYDNKFKIFSDNEYIGKDVFMKLFKKESKKEWKVL
jgi:hypothetical protein